MAFPGEKIAVYYDSFRLGLVSDPPKARLGHLNAGVFVLDVTEDDMVEIDPPSGVYAIEFTIPNPPAVFGDWVVLVKATISAVERQFAFPVRVTEPEFVRPLAESAAGTLSDTGAFIVHNLREIRRTSDRLALSRNLVDLVLRNRILAVADEQVARQGENALFHFQVVDEGRGGILNLEGATVRFKAVDAVTELAAWDVTCTITDAVLGRCEVVLSPPNTDTIGTFKAQIHVTLPDLSVVISQSFTVLIEPSV